MQIFCTLIDCDRILMGWVKSAPTLKAQSMVIFQYHPNRYIEKDIAKGFFKNMFF